MRINKLFHWLYFVLMSLPIFAMLSAILVSTFNMSAKEEIKPIYQYDTNEVNSVNDIKVNNIYHINISQIDSMNNGTIAYGTVLFATQQSEYISVESEVNGYGRIFKGSDANSTYIACEYFNYQSTRLTTYYYDYNDFDFVYLRDFNLNYLPYITSSEKLNIVDYQSDLINSQDIFYNSLDRVATNPLFTWAQASFLGVPVSYLGGIFGLASNSVINILLCYWVAISIIWLMFDVLMFVPMLVHKSIDKVRF